MKRSLMLALLGCSVGVALAKPVKVDVSYKNVQSLSNQLSNSDCRRVIKDNTFVFDRDNPVDFKASGKQKVSDSHTVIKTQEGPQTVLIKLGKSTVTTPAGKQTVDRVSYIRWNKNGTATGKLVLDGLCSADFTSKRVK